MNLNYNVKYVYQNLTAIQKKEIIELWITAKVVEYQEALQRVEQVSTTITFQEKIVGVSTVYLHHLGDRGIYFFFRMFIKEEFRGSNLVRKKVMQTNFQELKKRFSNKAQGIAVELENQKLASLGKNTHYMQKRGYEYFSQSSKDLQLWYVDFKNPKGIFVTKELNIIKVIGIPDDNMAKVLYNDGFFKDFSLFFDGNSSFLENVEYQNAQIKTLYLGGKKQFENLQLDFVPDVVVNMMCDPEIQTKSLKIFENINFQGKVFNHPLNILKTKRDTLSRELPINDDFIIPKTYRIAPKEKQEIVDFVKTKLGNKSFLFRPVVSHGGEGLIKVEDIKKENFQEFIFDGTNEYFITEFIDFKSEDGLYKKARFFVIDGEIVPRHYIISQDWKIHSQSRDDESFTQQEEEFLSNPPKIFFDFCNYLYNYVALDFFGVDCAILPSGKIVLFEANVCMRPYAHHQKEYLKNSHQKVLHSFGKLLWK